jgi:UDP-2-acetamido-3-amino-2,3-dideoxy-glucuronate N-acetyltransferase
MKEALNNMEDVVHQQNTPRIAVVGMGYWGKNLVRNFYELGNLRAICDSQADVEAKCAEHYKQTRFVKEYSDLLADPEIDAVALATPAISHHKMAKAALKAGKDVFVEKPLSVDVQEGQELLDLSLANRRVLMVGHILRYHPAVVRLQQMIQKGELGKLYYIYSNRLNIGKIRTEENILWSFAPHDISVMLFLLGEMPLKISSNGSACLNRDIFDVTMSQFEFPSGVHGHIFVSWLHPVKEQKLVVVGSEKMAVFDDTSENKLVVYEHKVEWKNRIPTALKGKGEPIPLVEVEPLKAECQHFIESIKTRGTPHTDGREGLRVLKTLDACQRSLLDGGAVITLSNASSNDAPAYFAHESAFIDPGAAIGTGTKVWHFSHVLKGARIGERCVLGQNVNVDGGAVIGNNVKIQNNVSVYSGITVEDDVFLGPSCVLTNVSNPRSQVNRHSLYEKTLIRKGATVGANSTIVCGLTLGRYAFIAAGSVVTKNVPDYALMIGNPARQKGWMSRHGHQLSAPDKSGIMRCPESGFRYKEVEAGVISCLDLDESAPLPPSLQSGTKAYRSFKAEQRAD